MEFENHLDGLLLFRRQLVRHHKLPRAAQPQKLAEAILNRGEHGAFPVDTSLRRDFRSDFQKNAPVFLPQDGGLQIGELEVAAAVPQGFWFQFVFLRDRDTLKNAFAGVEQGSGGGRLSQRGRRAALLGLAVQRLQVG